ncbi:MAG TPA: hypothetical protein VFE17_05220 [Candidatus Baltobacteraceae bacterium]|jgi:hypothetical protein|nr:hypothetical protein [Candidatus Baltobacteraceae bacterium]
MKFKALFFAALIVAPQIIPAAPALAQGSSSEGCMNQWLFNGVWRARITKVEPVMNGSAQTGWQVTETWRNGTSRELAPADSFMQDQKLVLNSGTLTAEGHRQEGLAFNTLAPSGQYSYVQTFFGPNSSVDPSDKPKTLQVTFDGAKLAASTSKPHFTSNKYNFNYNLTCVATGAAAQAQGGSTQVAASEGCMNQWMSNGVWKMRVVKVIPNPPDATASNQYGWRVRQEWVNITNRNVFPGALPDATQHAVQTNVSDEYLATKGGNNASSFNAVGGFAIGARNIPFPPGSSYTFEQPFGWSPFNATDTPTRLVVTFDVAHQNALPGVPHYRKPANFRINLACGSGAIVSASQPAATGQQAAAPPPAASQNQTAATTSTQSANGNGLKVDPCAMLGTPDLASALGVGVRSVGSPQRPSPNECAWAVASRAGAPAQNVLLVMQPVAAAKTGCHGFSCLSVVQSVLGSHVPGVPSQFSEAFNDAQLISGLGDKASWKDGRLTVLRADMGFQLLVHGNGSPALNTSEALARDVLYRLPTP